MNIDYSKLNERIVKQAYHVLDAVAKKQLIQDKIDRADALIKSREASVRGSKYPASR
jgi:hypothetical protein